MALQLDKQYKGFTANYWCITSKIWNKNVNRTTVTLDCFKDAATRALGLGNAIEGLRKTFTFNGDLDIADIYTQIKAYENMTLSGVSVINDKEFELAIDC